MASTPLFRNGVILPSISIGIPTYNQGEFLVETLDSVLNQDVPPKEVVVSNNHSTDGTATILRQYENRVRVIQPPIHLGMVENWNFLCEHLTGDWISLLSSDDVALPC